MSDDSRYNFRFGTYGSQNPLYSAIEVEAEYGESSSSMAGVIDGGSDGITASTEGLSPFEGLNAFLNDNMASITFTRNKYGMDPPSKIKISSEKFNSEITSNLGYSLTISMDVELVLLNISTPLKTGTVTMIVLLEDKSGNKVQKSKGYTWSDNIPIAVGSISIQLDADTLKNYTFLGITLNVADNTKLSLMGNINGTYTFKNFNFVFKKITKEATIIPKYMSVGGEKIYLCPWELKHIDSITMSLAGSTSTMGVPNKPASRTQIFDTGGPVRTFKISGRRYDWEENVSNWDFVNTQFNLASDSEYPSIHPYTYVGLSWLLSTMQILLKGYQFYIGNDDTTDKRFLSSEPYSLEYAIPLAVVPKALPHNEGAIIKYTGETGTYVNNAHYICDVTYNSKWQETPDLNVARTWNVNTEYIPGQIVVYKGRQYGCEIANKGNYPSLYSDYWNIFGPVVYEWDAETTYHPVQSVLFNNILYFVSNYDDDGNNINKQPDLHPEYWTVFAMDINSVEDWSSVSTYSAGQYVKHEGRYYVALATADGDDEPGETPSARWVKYIPPVDNGFNVALTSLNTTFSESEPGLMSYSISLTERYKNGTKLYQPYNPEYIDTTQ